MGGQIVILSDTHLGRPCCGARSAEALRPLWDEASHLILNGDVAEVHHPRHWAKAAAEALHLYDLCARDGVAITLLSGNHDPFISELRHLHVAHGQVFITHGDVIHPAIAPWSPAAGRLRKAYERALDAAHPESRDRLETRLSAARQAAQVEWGQLETEAAHSSVGGMLLRPWTVLQVLRYWHVFPDLAARFVQQHAPQARFAVLGHTHRPGVWTIDQHVIINTGGFGLPSRPWAVVIHDDRLIVRPIRFRRGAYAFGPRVVADYPLSSVPQAGEGEPSAPNTRPGNVRPSTAAM